MTIVRRTVNFFLLLQFCICKGEIPHFKTNVTNDRFSEYNEVVIEILSACHYEYRMLLIYDDYEGKNAISFWNENITDAFIIFNQFYQSKKTKKSKETFVIDAVFIITYEKETFPNIIANIKSTQWWNPLVPFHVLSKSNHSCGDRIQILRTSWKYNIVELLLICQMYDAQKNPATLIYTYSPYGNHMPRPWQQLTQYSSPSSTFRIYNRLYQKGKLCQRLDFDRCRNLNGAKLKLGIDYNDRSHRIPEEYQWDKFLSERVSFFFLEKNEWVHLVKKYLNINYEATFIGKSILRKANDTSLMKRANEMEIDIILFTIARKIQDYVVGYPYLYTDYTIVSMYQGFRNLFEHTYYLLGKWMLAGMSVLLTITFSVIWYSNRQKTVFFAILDIVRLLINSSLETKMETFPSRIFFMVIFLYFLIIQTLFQGELANFFTNPIRNPGVKSLTDMGSTSTIFSTPEINLLFEKNSELKRKIKVLNEPSDCILYLLMDMKSACIISRYHAHDIALIGEIYISPDVIYKNLAYHLFRKNSPLRNRINMASLVLWEHGFSNMMMETLKEHKSRVLKRKATLRIENKRPISRQNIHFMFIFLIIGLVCALFCFISEVIFHKYQKPAQKLEEWKNKFCTITFKKKSSREQCGNSC